MHVFRNILWVFGIIYATIPAFWMAVHPFAAYWRARKRNPFSILLLMWASIILVGVAITRPWHNQQLYSTPFVWIPAALLFACALFIYRRSGRIFGLKNFIGRTELASQTQGQTLVTSGIHARLRHPIYLGHLLMLTSWTLGSGLVVMVALLAFAVITGALMIRMEDAELEARFGDQFRAYKKRVPAIFTLP